MKYNLRQNEGCIPLLYWLIHVSVTAYTVNRFASLFFGRAVIKTFLGGHMDARTIS